MKKKNEAAAEKAISRRTLLAGAAAAGIPATVGLAATKAETADDEKPHTSRGRIHQSVCKWCYKMPLDEHAKNAARLGYKGIDLVNHREWPTVKKYRLVPTMAPGAASISRGWNRKEDHDRLAAQMKKNIELAAEADVPNVIKFSGNRRGLPDDVGIKNCVAGLKRVASFAEEKKITMCMELLNSRVNHKDYQCEHTTWASTWSRE